ncbi:hypothetical protein [Microbulbifer rhizosphaerae]|uniref:Uncharacterized protein n=1 Tax=Microbulbifer rhizosphaerae TaxID=1562603 RepID=A0A7W4WF66_9GAMM|nr:hypothetical protein [Microbulbifer rhizosphaerae]MBB3063110.1 hypothetical protein [Microbulbifer rhizosphaerae]
MLPPNIDQYIRTLAQPNNIQTTCSPPQEFQAYATNFQRDSQAGFGYSRSKDGLTRIDQLVATASRINTLDYMRIAFVSEQLLRALYTWTTGFNPSAPNQQLDLSGINRRRNAVLALMGGAYCWYKQSWEAAGSESLAINHINNRGDIPFAMYNYRFSRNGFNLHQAPNRLYRGDTRPPAMLWQAGGFYPKMMGTNRFDPHLGTGASNQVISSTTDANLVTRFAWHNRVYCPKRYYYIYDAANRPISGFIYEFDKSGHQCVEVAGTTPGREVAFLAIPNQFIRRFRMRYYAGSQNNIQVSDWMYYNQASVQNIRIESDEKRWKQLKNQFHSNRVS